MLFGLATAPAPNLLGRANDRQQTRTRAATSQSVSRFSLLPCHWQSTILSPVRLKVHVNKSRLIGPSSVRYKRVSLRLPADFFLLFSLLFLPPSFARSSAFPPSLPFLLSLLLHIPLHFLCGIHILFSCLSFSSLLGSPLSFFALYTHSLLSTARFFSTNCCTLTRSPVTLSFLDTKNSSARSFTYRFRHPLSFFPPLFVLTHHQYPAGPCVHFLL